MARMVQVGRERPTSDTCGRREAWMRSYPHHQGGDPITDIGPSQTLKFPVPVRKFLVLRNIFPVNFVGNFAKRRCSTAVCRPKLDLGAITYFEGRWHGLRLEM
jgi:hypothetical protein